MVSTRTSTPTTRLPLDEHGRLLGHREFPAYDTGYADLLSWIAGFGSITAIGVESTGSSARL
jgi:transposase